MSIESENGGVKKPIMPVKIGKPATVNVKDSEGMFYITNVFSGVGEQSITAFGTVGNVSAEMILLKVMNLLMKQMKIIIQTK